MTASCYSVSIIYYTGGDMDDGIVTFLYNVTIMVCYYNTVIRL